MKNIELTEEHKSKLLEMCKKLFPEYKYWNLHDGTCDLCTENTLDYSIEEKPEWNSWNRIHWFEFCLTYLAPKICDGKTYYIFCDKCNFHKINSKEFSKEFISKYLQHPVDYLYEEFKKLKV